MAPLALHCLETGVGALTECFLCVPATLDNRVEPISNLLPAPFGSGSGFGQ